MSGYSDNDFKFVAILNKKIELPKLLNALGHVSVGLTSLIDIGNLRFLEYEDGDKTKHPAISKYPFIILKADNSNQIRAARDLAICRGIVYNDFVDTMIGASADNQLSQTANKYEKELEYYAIILFGSAQELNGITKKHSFVKGISSISKTTANLMFH